MSTREKSQEGNGKLKRGWYVKGIDRNFYPLLKPAPLISGPHKYKDALRIFHNHLYRGVKQMQLVHVK